MPARLIVNADDCGLTRGINRSVGELHRARVLTSTTLMAGGAAFADALTTLSSHPTLGVGCHLVFVDGIPVSDRNTITTLVDGIRGTFRQSFSTFLSAAILGSIAEDDLVQEGTAQVERLQAVGVSVTHLDTHKHTHLVPLVTRSLLRIAERCGVGAIRNPFEPSWSLALGHGGVTRRASIRLLSAGFRTTFRALMKANQHIYTTDGSIGVAATGRLTQRALGEMLTAIPDSGTWELVVHPGYDDAELAATRTRLRASREVEQVALAQLLPRAAIEHGHSLIHYGDL